MYAQDVPSIKEFAEASPEGLASVITFALLSARTRFERLQHDVASVRKHGIDSPALWGWKRDGYLFVQANKADLHSVEPSRLSVMAAMDLFVSTVPGLGLIKAGFVCQMLGQEVACLDARNREQLGVDTRFFDMHNKGLSSRTRQRRISEYLAFSTYTGGAQYWWDDWCNRMGDRLGTTGDDISRQHVKLVRDLDPSAARFRSESKRAWLNDKGLPVQSSDPLPESYQTTITRT